MYNLNFILVIENLNLIFKLYRYLDITSKRYKKLVYLFRYWRIPFTPTDRKICSRSWEVGLFYENLRVTGFIRAVFTFIYTF